MSDESIGLLLEVLDRSAFVVNTATLEGDLYQALEEGLPANGRQAIIDALALRLSRRPD